MATDEDLRLWPVRTAEWMHFDVTTSVDPLLDDVFVALPAHRQPPTDEDYTVLEPAEWVPGQAWSADNPTVAVRAWIPKDHLTRGNKYDPWVLVIDNPEHPEMRAGADPVTGEGGTIVRGV